MGLPSQVSAKKAAIPAGFVSTEAPDGPGRACGSLTGRLSGLAARQDVSPGLLVSYLPLARPHSRLVKRLFYALCVQIAAVRSCFDIFAAPAVWRHC